MHCTEYLNICKSRIKQQALDWICNRARPSSSICPGNEQTAEVTCLGIDRDVQILEYIHSRTFSATTETSDGENTIYPYHPEALTWATSSD